MATHVFRTVELAIFKIRDQEMSDVCANAIAISASHAIPLVNRRSKWHRWQSIREANMSAFNLQLR
jgi:hypothetical protein